MLNLARCGAVASIAVALSGCSAQSSSPATGGDCSPRVRYHGTVYESPTTVNENASVGERAGQGDVIGCDGKSVESPAIRAVKGVGLDVAVAVGGDSDYHGVYVSRDVPEASWPSQVKASP